MSRANAPPIEPALFDPARLDRADTLICAAPFPYFIAREQLPAHAAADLDRDFPQYPSAGFFPYEANECGPSINALIAQLTAPASANAIGARLGVENLGNYPALVTVCRYINKRHGTIHTDSRSKVVTALLYLNAHWPDTSEGCLRFLRHINNIDDLVAPEIRPIYGNVVAFRRAANSFHGHLPHEGERRVIQIAWLVSEDEKLRKTQRGKISRLLKKLFGSLDRKLGASRDRNAAHKK